MEGFPISFSNILEISFENADISFQLDNVELYRSWLVQVIELEKAHVAELNYVFCSDDYLHKLNVQYLDHNTLTDIITFPINENPIQSDLFISIDRVRDNAKDFGLSFDEELKRVIIHGLLHLLGFGDKTAAEQKEMRSMEDRYIQKFPSGKV